LVFYVALILFFLLSIVSATIRAWFVNVCCWKLNGIARCMFDAAYCWLTACCSRVVLVQNSSTAQFHFCFFYATWPDVQVAEMFGCINHVCINHVYIHDCHDVGSQNAFWLCYMANDLYAWQFQAHSMTGS
jgi:hypothetical protein